MTLVDLIVLAILGISAVLGLSRGLVREMLGLGAWLLAAYAADLYGGRFEPAAEKAIGNPDIAAPVAYGLVFLVMLIVLSLLANLVGRMVRFSMLGGLDRTLGLVFGLVRGAAVLVAAYILGALMLPPDHWPPQMRQARTIPIIYDGAAWVAERLPEKYRPNVQAPPEERMTTAEDLLHATPEGSALGPPPSRN
jgi:membrane protein required for colicin V production